MHVLMQVMGLLWNGIKSNEMKGKESVRVGGGWEGEGKKGEVEP